MEWYCAHMNACVTLLRYTVQYQLSVSQSSVFRQSLESMSLESSHLYRIYRVPYHLAPNNLDYLKSLLRLNEAYGLRLNEACATVVRGTGARTGDVSFTDRSERRLSQSVSEPQLRAGSGQCD